jgi:hypothetical protein
MKLTTKNIALMAAFAALFYVSSLVSPFIPAVGIPEITIKLEALLASVFGLVMGPYLGFLTAFLGALLTWVLPPSGGTSFGLPFLLSPPLNALVVGLIFYKKWKYAFAAFAVLIAAFWFLPPSQPLTEFWYIGVAVTWDKIIALALIFPVVKLARFKTLKMQLLFYFLLAFIGNQADNMWGSDIFAVPLVHEGIFGTSLETVRFLFVVSPFVYPIIRIIQAAIVMVIAIPLLKALESSALVSLKGSILTESSVVNSHEVPRR